MFVMNTVYVDSLSTHCAVLVGQTSPLDTDEDGSQLRGHLPSALLTGREMEGLQLLC